MLSDLSKAVFDGLGTFWFPGAGGNDGMVRGCGQVGREDTVGG